jgi:catechol 2,3-dioxygenase-like lactoylglutathione lyase family enzyme
MHTHAEAQQPLRHITHDVTLHVSDSQRSLAFYRDLLGFSLIEQQAIEGQPGAVVLLMDTGNGNRLRLENFPTQPQPSAVAPALPDLPQAQGQGELVYDHVAITSETEEAGDGTNLSRRLCMGYCNCFLSN